MTFTGMNKSACSFADKRLMSLPECGSYLGISPWLARKWAKEMKALGKIGSRCLIDKKAVDEALDRMAVRG